MVFGAGAEGIQAVRAGVTENQELIKAILVHEFTIDPDAPRAENLAEQIISPKVNRAYDLAPINFENPVQLGGLGYILNPEIFSTTQSTDASLTRMTYPEKQNGNDTFSGVKIENFGLKNIDVDFSQFGTERNFSTIKICADLKLEVATSLAFDFNARDKNYPVALKNIEIPIDSQQTEPMCFNAKINMATFSVESLERIGEAPLITRPNLTTAFKNPDLKIELPSTTPLAKLPPESLNDITAGYLLPVLSNETIIKAIETPIIFNVKEVLKDQLNTLIGATLSNQSDMPRPEIRLPMFNLSNDMIRGTIDAHLTALENEHKKSIKKNTSRRSSNNINCSSFTNRMDNINYWMEQNPSFKDAALAERLKQFTSDARPTDHKCKKSKNFSKIHQKLVENVTKMTPSPRQTEELIVRQLNKVGQAGDLAVEIFIPELCEGDYSSALAGREAPQECDNFYSMLDISYINNFLAKQIESGHLCSVYRNGKCGIRVLDDDGTNKERDEDATFACDDMESIALSGLGKGKMRGTISLKDCMSKGKRSLINLGLWHLGSFDNTDFELSYDVTLSHECPAGKKVCFKVEFKKDLLKYKGGLEDSTFEGKVKSALSDELKKLEDKLTTGLNNFPIEDFTAGLDITKIFGNEASETSPGFIGACLKTDGKKGSNIQACLVARSRLPANHPALAKYCSGK